MAAMRAPFSIRSGLNEAACPSGIGKIVLNPCDVHAALAGHQELAPDRGHGVVEVDGEAGVGERLGGHQPGRPAADDDGAG